MLPVARRPTTSSSYRSGTRRASPVTRIARRSSASSGVSLFPATTVGARCAIACATGGRSWGLHGVASARLIDRLIAALAPGDGPRPAEATRRATLPSSLWSTHVSKPAPSHSAARAAAASRLSRSSSPCPVAARGVSSGSRRPVSPSCTMRLSLPAAIDLPLIAVFVGRSSVAATGTAGASAPLPTGGVTAVPTRCAPPPP